MKKGLIFILCILAVAGLHAQEEKTADKLPPNTWVKAEVDFGKALKDYLDGKDGRWSTTDGYSDNVYRSKTGTVVIRTGIASKALGMHPGYYTNTTVEWNPADDTAKVTNVVPWGGGSGGNGKLLAGYRENIAPTPRHTYDGICYVADTDEMYMMLGANWKIQFRQATEEAKAELKKDGGRTWAYSFEKKRWTCIEDNVWKVFKTSPYENHMEYWPAGKKILFFNSSGSKYAEFDLTKKKWEKGTLKNKCPMSLYNARSAWDSKRGLWIFRLGPRLCTFDPKEKKFEKLPNCYDMKIPTRKELKKMKKQDRDPRLFMKGVCYVSKHDRYLVCGPTGNDTAAYDPETKKWTPVKGGDIKLINGYMKYNPKLDIVAMNFQLKCFKFRYVLEKSD